MGNATQIASCSDIGHAGASSGSRSRSLKGAPKPAAGPQEQQSAAQQASAWYGKMCKSQASQDLFAAALKGDVKAAMTALVAHADSNCCNAEGLTPLMMSAAGGHLEVARLLVTSNARVNAAPTRHGYSPLSLAAAQGSLEVARLLLQWHADPNLGRVSGNSPLSRAAARGHLETCAALLDHQADLNAHDAGGVTAAMLAVEHGHLEAAQLLIQRGAPGGRCDQRSRSALHRAVEQLLRLEPRMGGIAALRKPMDEYDYWVELCNILLESKAGIDVVEQGGDTLLAKAVRHRRRDVLMVLLDAGADRDFPVPALTGGTALMLATEQGERDLCQALILRAASVNQPSATGLTPLCIAVDKGDEELCLYLVQCSADFNRRDPRDGTLLVLKAASKGMRSFYDRLLPHIALEAVSAGGPPVVSHLSTNADDSDAEYSYVSDDSA